MMEYVLCLYMDGDVYVVGWSDKPEFNTSGIEKYTWFIAKVLETNIK